MAHANDGSGFTTNGLEIAVVGMAGRFAAAGSIDEFWSLLKEGREGLTVLSESELMSEDERIRDLPNYVRMCGAISRKREFDADFFGYTAHEASLMDPQFGVLHEVAWEALENAGYDAEKFDGLIGIYAGASNNLDWIRRLMKASDSIADLHNLSSLTEAEYLPLRVAHKLGLTGPAISVNTTCSTSMVNIHLACQALIGGECDMALAGAVNVSIDNKGYLHQEHMVLSADGRCRPFDASADGTISSECCAILVLRRLEDALADRDNIVAIIKGTAINNDGRQKAGFSAPSAEGQARVIRDALTRAEVDAESIRYVEAHGTATRIGDPIEISALRQVYGDGARERCPIGSVKSNLGHPGEAAGVAGAIKTILSLQHKLLPPSLNYRSPNPLLQLESSPFYVNVELREWRPREGERLRAGVSSFGIGGTNAHMILEEAPPTATSGAARTRQLIFLSANTGAALGKMERALSAHVLQNPDLPIADLAYTLHVGRKEMAHRKALVIASPAELATFGERCDRFVAHGVVDRSEPKMCYLFPDRGGQYRDMGRELYEEEEYFRAQMDSCFEIADALSGRDCRAHLFGNADELDREEIADVLTFVFEYSLARLLLHWGLKPEVYLGYGVGEYVAACLSGVFTLKDAIALAIARGRSAERRQPSSGRDGSQYGEVADIARSIDRDANAGRPATAGGRDADAATTAPSGEAGASVTPPSDLEFVEALEKVRLSIPEAAFVSSVSGRWITDDEATSREYWARQRSAHAGLDDSVAVLREEGFRLFIEVGAGRRPEDLLAEHGRVADDEQTIRLIPSAAERVPGADDIRLFEGLCRLFVAGKVPDWRRYYAGQERRRIPLPAYPFEGRCHYTPESLAAQAWADPGHGEARIVSSADETKTEACDELEAIRDKLVEIWRKFLGNTEIDIHDDVFDHGVDSLLSIRVITEIRETFSADVSLDSIFSLRTVAEQAEEIQRKTSGAQSLKISPIRPYAHNGIAPLSTSQKRLWIISRLEDDYTPYNNGFLVPMKTAKADILERAFRALIERHTILRTRYFAVDGQPMQQIRDEFDFAIERFDLRGLSRSERMAETQRLWQRALTQPIDLEKDLMLRANLIRYEEDADLLLVAQHHICTDDWSDNVLMEELRILYEAYSDGRENPLPPLPLQYIDYAIWQNEWLDNVVQQQLPYWRQKLDGLPPVHGLPLDYQRPKHQSYKGLHCRRHVDSVVLDGLKRVSDADDATLFMTMQAAFSLFLSRYSGEDDIVLGFAVANRLHKEVEGLIGFFVNTLVLRSDLSGNQSFRSFNAQTKKNLLGAYANSHVPFEVLVDELNPTRSTSYEPIVQIQLIYLNQSHGQGGLDVGEDEKPEAMGFEVQAPFSKYDLTLFFSVDDDGMHFTWEYATDLFAPATIQRMAECFETLLRSIVADPDCPIRDLPMTADRARTSRNASHARERKEYDLDVAETETWGEFSFEFSLFYFASDDGKPSAEKYRLLIEGARFGDRHGFEAVWMPERHFDAFGGAYPNPAITAAALASITQRINLRAGSCVLPLHNPVRLAEDWSVIDNLSGGRVGLGFAAGYAPRDFTLAPGNYEARREVHIDGVKTVKALWRGESIQMADGKGEATEISIRPRPIQRELPVWVTTAGNEEAFRYAGRNGDNVLTHLMNQTLDELAGKIRAYRSERIAAGHAGEGKITLLMHAFITDDERSVFEHAKAPFKQYLIDSVGTPQTITKELGLGDLGGDVNAITELAFNRYYQSGALFGTPERCLPLVQAIRSAGVNELACLVDFGVEPEHVLDALPRLARLRDMSRSSVGEGSGSGRTGSRVARETVREATIDEVDGQERVVSRLFEAAAERFPDACAVVYEAESLDYAELNMRANRIAHRLISQHGAAPDVRIGLCMARSVDLVIGILAILKSGAAYVPIEPDLPPERIAYMVEDAGMTVALTCAAGDAALAALPTIRLRIDHEREFSEFPCHDPEVDLHPRHAMYVMYTSGSTGKPKGVVVEHRSIVNFWNALCETTHSGLEANSRVTLNTSVGFDVSLFALLQLLSGHCLYVVPASIRDDGARFVDFLRTHSIDVMECTPTQFNLLLAAGFLEESNVRPSRVLFCGEAISAPVWNRLKASVDTEYYNLYGPTECTVASTFCRIAPDSEGPHIGKPILNTDIHLLDAGGEPVPPGAIGEIHIGGAGLARGYLNRPEQTAERFLSDPFSPSPDARMYKTGDLGRWLPDGSLEFRGRNDFQVKLRGFRIELSEIEARLATCEGVQEAAVVVREDMPDDGRLVAYVVPKPHTTLSATALRRQLQLVLPAYMLPAAYVAVESFPMTSSGKLDRIALCATERPSLSVGAYEEPIGPVESAIVAVWRDLLGVERVGRHDNFFDLGGHSLRSIAMIERLRQRGIAIDKRAIFNAPTVAELAIVASDIDAVDSAFIPPNLIPRDCLTITPDMLPLAEIDQAEIDRLVAQIPGGAANVQDIYPLSALQEGILFHHLIETVGDIYLMRTIIGFDTRERLDTMLRAIQIMIDRHDILRTSVHWQDMPRPLQVVHRTARLPVYELKLSRDSALAELQESTATDAIRIDLGQAPMLAAHVGQDANTGEWLLSLLSHHMIGDHISAQLVVAEIQKVLEGNSEQLPAPIPYRNYIARSLAASVIDQTAFFRSMLSDVVEPTDPFGTLAARAGEAFESQADRRIDDELSLGIRECARRLRVSPAAVFHVVFAHVLAKCSGRDDVVFGTVLSGRMQDMDHVDQLIGMFINTLPMRMKLDRAGVGEAIRSAHSGLGELMEHEQASLVLAQNCSRIQLPMPLFTALIDYRHSRFDGGEISEVWDGVRLVSDAVRNNYPLTLLVDDLGDAFSLKIRTASGIDAARIMNYVETSIGEIVRGADPAQERMLLDLEILPSSERQLLLEGFNRTQADHAHDRTIHRLFEAQAARTPQATAVESGSRRLSYAELNRHADKVAGRLIALGVKPDDRVAVCIDRSPEMVIGILGALKAGGAYVPLDPLYPADRLAYMLEDCAPVAVLTRASLHAGLPMPQSPTVPVLDVEEIVRSSPDAAPDPGFSGSKAANLAYVIYTSGSTGRPKGVMVEHRSAVNFWEVMRRTTHRDCGEAARVGLNAAFSFDMSLKGLLQLLSGHCVVLIPQEVRASGAALLEFIERHRIDVFDITPSQMEPLLAAGLLDGAGHRPRDVLLGGEAIGTTMWDRLKSSPKVRFHNMYGPTECTVDATIQRMSEATGGPVIGSPVANTRIYLLDPVGRPVPIGAIGEIHIGGVQVARGYLNRPELTAERFLQDPFSQDPSSRMYRTGDLGRWRSDGTLEYAGRNDMQVKLRGFRIELGEIEAKLAACAGVREAVATVRKDAARDERLVAYVVAHPGATPSAMELRERLSQSLPDYMIPSAFVRLDRLPLTPNGKLDRRALPAPDMASVSSRGYEPPAGEAEQVLAEIWRTLLGLERVGRQDHFFELGGHSLLVMQLVNRIRKQFHVDVPLRTLFDRPVLSDLAESIVGIQGEVFLGDDLERMQSELGALSVEELQRILDRESIDQ